MGDCAFPVSGVPFASRISYAVNGRFLQRLFSTFPNGWPGLGLLLLRVLACIALVRYGIAGVIEEPPLTIVILHIIGVIAGILLLAGLWTPVAGSLVAIVKLWIAVSRILSGSGDPWIAFILAVLGAVLAMLGPGAWSIDARLFGRKRIDVPER
jgi:putative oxidoreductase